MSMPRPSNARADTPADELRGRARRLADLAASIERQPVMCLADTVVDGTWRTTHAGLCERVLRRNVHQLHRAADDLRATAYRLSARADRLQAASDAA